MVNDLLQVLCKFKYLSQLVILIFAFILCSLTINIEAADVKLQGSTPFYSTTQIVFDMGAFDGFVPRINDYHSLVTSFKYREGVAPINSTLFYQSNEKGSFTSQHPTKFTYQPNCQWAMVDVGDDSPFLTVNIDHVNSVPTEFPEYEYDGNIFSAHLIGNAFNSIYTNVQTAMHSAHLIFRCDVVLYPDHASIYTDYDSLLYELQFSDTVGRYLTKSSGVFRLYDKLLPGPIYASQNTPFQLTSSPTTLTSGNPTEFLVHVPLQLPPMFRGCTIYFHISDLVLGFSQTSTTSPEDTNLRWTFQGLANRWNPQVRAQADFEIDTWGATSRNITLVLPLLMSSSIFERYITLEQSEGISKPFITHIELLDPRYEQFKLQPLQPKIKRIVNEQFGVTNFISTTKQIQYLTTGSKLSLWLEIGVVNHIIQNQLNEKEFQIYGEIASRGQAISTIFLYNEMVWLGSITFPPLTTGQRYDFIFTIQQRIIPLSILSLLYLRTKDPMEVRILSDSYHRLQFESISPPNYVLIPQCTSQSTDNNSNYQLLLQNNSYCKYQGTCSLSTGQCDCPDSDLLPKNDFYNPNAYDCASIPTTCADATITCASPYIMKYDSITNTCTCSCEHGFIFNNCAELPTEITTIHQTYPIITIRGPSESYISYLKRNWDSNSQPPISRLYDPGVPYNNQLVLNFGTVENFFNGGFHLVKEFRLLFDVQFLDIEPIIPLRFTWILWKTSAGDQGPLGQNEFYHFFRLPTTTLTKIQNPYFGINNIAEIDTPIQHRLDLVITFRSIWETGDDVNISLVTNQMKLLFQNGPFSITLQSVNTSPIFPSIIRQIQPNTSLHPSVSVTKLHLDEATNIFIDIPSTTPSSPKPYIGIWFTIPTNRYILPSELLTIRICATWWDCSNTLIQQSSCTFIPNNTTQSKIYSPPSITYPERIYFYPTSQSSNESGEYQCNIFLPSNRVPFPYDNWNQLYLTNQLQVSFMISRPYLPESQPPTEITEIRIPIGTNTPSISTIPLHTIEPNEPLYFHFDTTQFRSLVSTNTVKLQQIRFDYLGITYSLISLNSLAITYTSTTNPNLNTLGGQFNIEMFPYVRELKLADLTFTAHFGPTSSQTPTFTIPVTLIHANTLQYSSVCDISCSNNGIVDLDTCTCDCSDTGYSGDKCTICSLQCDNGGIVNNNSCNCDCSQTNFIGNDCSICNDPSCQPCTLQCDNGGIIDTNTCTCDCATTGYSGDKCQTATDTNPTCNLTCQNNGQLNRDECKCDCTTATTPFWIGDNCNQCDLTCYNQGTRGINCDRCNCPKLYSGEQCQCHIIEFSISISNVAQSLLDQFQAEPDVAGTAATSLQHIRQQLITSSSTIIKITSLLENLQINRLQLTTEPITLKIYGQLTDNCKLDKDNDYKLIEENWVQFLTLLSKNDPDVVLVIFDVPVKVNEVAYELPDLKCDTVYNPTCAAINSTFQLLPSTLFLLVFILFLFIM